MSNPRTAAQAFRAQTLIHLLQNGLLVFDPNDDATPFRSMVTEADAWTDVAGCSPWTIHVRGGATGDSLSEALTEAGEAALAARSDWHAVIMRRKGHDIEDSYALMPLSIFTRILRGEAPEPPRPPRPVAGIGG